MQGSDVREGESAGNLAEPLRVRALLAAAAPLGVAPLDAQVLLAALLRKPRAQLLAFEEAEVDALTAALYKAALERRAAGEPLAYITGVKEFWSLPLSVAPGVLVPRPETELLVELCLDHLGMHPRRVADLGTGSGAIALALARERPDWQIVATDASDEALQIAALNRSRLGLQQVELRQGSWCDALPNGPFDAIVSNPPYVEPDHPALQALQHEPIEALVAADDGFADLHAIATQSRAHLAAGGLLLLEHGATQAAGLAAHLQSLGYTAVRCHRDAAGLDRATAAIWP